MHIPTLHLFAVCVLIWGSTWFAITLQLGVVSPELSVGYRFLLASAVLFAVCRWRGLPLRYTLAQHLDFILLGLTMFGFGYILVYHAEAHIASGMVAVGYSISPMINMLAARAIFGTPMTLQVLVGSLFGIAGICFVFWPEFGQVSASRNAELGALFTMLSVLVSSAGSMAAVRCQKRGYATWASMAWGMFYGGASALVAAAVLGRPYGFEFTPGYVLSLAYLAIFGSVVTFACYLPLIARIGAARAGYIGVMVPIMALAISYFLEKFAWTSLTTIGVILSVLGNVAMLRGKRET